MIFNQQGTALVATLGVILILLTAATQVARLAGRSADKVMAANQIFLARETALSAIHLSMLLLARDAADNENDSLQESWADPEVLRQMLGELGLPSSRIELTIQDEMGKLQLNGLLSRFPGNEARQDQMTTMERFFTLIDPIDPDIEKPVPAELIHSIKDWLDSGDNNAVTGLSGAESEYYESLDFPYVPANGPFTHVSELARVKGMSPQVMSMIPQDDVFTVFGVDDEKKEGHRYAFSGQVNINTAPESVIAALLPLGREHLAPEIARFRIEKSNEDAGYTHILEPGWYAQVIELSEKEKTVFNKQITYQSHLFRTDCRVRTEEGGVALSAVIKREKNNLTGKWRCRLLRMEEG